MQHGYLTGNSNLLLAFLDSLSGYFVLLVATAVCVIVFSYWLIPTEKILLRDHSETLEPQPVQNIENTTEIPFTPNCKLNQHKIIVDKLKSHLTEEELANEKKIESQQLEEIFKLMKEQESKFQLESKQDLEDQLKLYGL